MKKSFCIFSIFVLCFAGTAMAQKAVTQQQTAKAEQEDASALNRRGVQYYLEKDYVQAIKCFRAAAEQGHAVAQYNLGTCYQEGKGVTQNYAEAVKWTGFWPVIVARSVIMASIAFELSLASPAPTLIITLSTFGICITLL